MNYPTIKHPAQHKSIELLYGTPSKAGNNSIYSHQQARLSESKIQMMVTTQLIGGQSPFEAFSLSVLD